jgi:pilus assembly protein CpaE
VKAVLARGGKSKAAAAQPPSERGQVIGIIAARGGLGLSTLAVNLGISIHNRTDKEVIVAEFRPGEGSMALELGFMKPEGLNRLLDLKVTDINPTSVEKEILNHSSGVRLLPASYQPRDSRHLASGDSFEAIARRLAYMSEYLLLDLGPGISPISEKVLGICDNLIVVVEPVPYTILRTKALLEDLSAKGFGEGRIHVVLVNRIRTELQLSWSQVQEQIGHTLAVAFTPAPEIIYQAAKANIPVVIQQPDSLINQQFAKLTETITKMVRQKV